MIAPTGRLTDGPAAAGEPTPQVDPAPGVPGREGTPLRWARRLAALDDTPHRTALAFAFGVFLSFSPLLGLQIALGLAAALLFRLHRVAVLAGLCTNLPAITIPYYAAATAAGALLTGSALTQDAGMRLAGVFSVPVYRAAFWQGALEQLAPFFVAFLVGSTICALALGLSAYFTVRPVLAKYGRARRGRLEAGPVSENC